MISECLALLSPERCRIFLGSQAPLKGREQWEQVSADLGRTGWDNRN